MIDTKEWPCAFYSWITGWQKWLSDTNRSEEDVTAEFRKPVGMISRCQKWYFSVPRRPSDLCRTQFLISFVFQSQSILAPVTHYKWPHCLQKAGVSVVKGRRNQSKPTSQSLIPSPMEALGVPALLGSKWRRPKVDLQIEFLQGQLAVALQSEGDTERASP